MRRARTSNGKSKGEGNRKNGNKYLSWAYVEAANFAIRFSPEMRAWAQRKQARTGKRVVAVKALACKLTKACFFMMRALPGLALENSLALIDVSVVTNGQLKGRMRRR